jgi:hypothetical protein
MPAITAQLTEAIVDELNGEAWTLPFAARRDYRPRYTVADLANLTVTVSPRTLAITPVARGLATPEYTIDIAIQQHLNQEDNDTLDALIMLAEHITQHMINHRLRAMPTALCIRATSEPLYSIDHLDDHRVFTSLITLTYALTASIDP